MLFKTKYYGRLQVIRPWFSWAWWIDVALLINSSFLLTRPMQCQVYLVRSIKQMILNLKGKIHSVNVVEAFSSITRVIRWMIVLIENSLFPDEKNPRYFNSCGMGRLFAVLTNIIAVRKRMAFDCCSLPCVYCFPVFQITNWSRNVDLKCGSEKFNCHKRYDHDNENNDGD